MIRLPLTSVLATGLIIGCLGNAGCATLPTAAPHAQTSPSPTSPNIAPRYAPIVVAAEPEAAEAGMAVLKRGGTAADAAVAVQTVLGLVEPQSSGLGGGSFMLYYDAKTGQITDYNGRETAPAAATPDMFIGADGKPLDFLDAVVSGRATGVPGAMHLLDRAQREHGNQDWASLFTAAESLADNGFTVTRRLGNYLQNVDFPQKHTPDFIAYLGDGKGGYRQTGDIIKNPAYGDTLRAFAKQRGEVLRKGPIAEAIVAKTHDAPLPGGMTMADLKTYSVKATTTQPYATTGDYQNRAVCITYRIYIVCSNNAPAGGIALLQGLKIAESQPIGQWGVHDPRAWQALIETERLMYADRDQYVADTDLFRSQTNAYLDPAYIKGRADLIRIGQANPAPKAGVLPMTVAMDQTIEPGGTTHFVIRDSYGNVVSMTTTVESFFGTGRMVGGFFLNNQLTDFSFSPSTADGMPIANSVAGGKHPRSSMAPVIVFDATGKTVVAAVGSPGGTSILSYNLKVLFGILDWGLPMQDAINLPNVVSRGDSIRIEQGRMEPAVWDGLVAMGYKLTPVSGEESGLNGILKQPDGSFDGGSDPRREGVVVK
ncbi:gamma-glutamyltransferase family protein [Asticcacaulis sp. 201]|uniref:gamma-glutamyltransferase family protein n=1 Tax=Asticcacaulis sp. 201 TaxID=3028787 RepID=UPI00291710B8|nr:gamma-glutamyltransferase family protein [Asticcacaulis sp. 201]MDV6330479.1 gamma-glutamyltransferase family protein [Asticcacaulis sp. 201]